MIDINGFYKIQKIEVHNPKIEFVSPTDEHYDFAIQLYLDKQIAIPKFGIGWVNTEYQRFTVPYPDIFNYRDGCILTTSNVISKIKVEDYIYFSANIFIEKDKEILGNFIGNLQNPDIQLINLCMAMINNKTPG